MLNPSILHRPVVDLVCLEVLLNNPSKGVCSEVHNPTHRISNRTQPKALPISSVDNNQRPVACLGTRRRSQQAVFSGTQRRTRRHSLLLVDCSEIPTHRHYRLVHCLGTRQQTRIKLLRRAAVCLGTWARAPVRPQHSPRPVDSLAIRHNRRREAASSATNKAQTRRKRSQLRAHYSEIRTRIRLRRVLVEVFLGIRRIREVVCLGTSQRLRVGRYLASNHNRTRASEGVCSGNHSSSSNSHSSRGTSLCS